MSQNPSVLVLSHNSDMWSDLLAEGLWVYHVTSSFNAVENILKQSKKLVLVVDLSCGRLDANIVRHFVSLYQGLRILACLQKHQVRTLSYIDLSSLSKSCIDYFTIPIPREMLSRVIGHQIGMVKLGYLKERTQYDSVNVNTVIGESHAIKRLKQQTRKVSSTDANVLLLGESGTGKELVARAIHENSERCDKPFVAVNCGALNEQLIHSELFGHEKGAFTGASQNRQGKIAMAHKGTLFLDEIGDLPLSQQANLLRFLQEGTIDVLGSTSTLKVDVRVISATHVNLEQAVNEGRFRQDLYYRINVLRLNVPTLRERKGDILLLAEFYKHKVCEEHGMDEPEFSPEAEEILLNYNWPGNVRELINIVKRASLMCEEQVILPVDLDIKLASDEFFHYSHQHPHELINAIEANKGNVNETAKTMGVSRATLYRLIEKYDLRTILARARS